MKAASYVATWANVPGAIKLLISDVFRGKIPGSDPGTPWTVRLSRRRNKITITIQRRQRE